MNGQGVSVVLAGPADLIAIVGPMYLCWALAQLIRHSRAYRRAFPRPRWARY